MLTVTLTVPPLAGTELGLMDRVALTVVDGAASTVTIVSPICATVLSRP